MKEEKSKSELEERNIDWLYRIHKDIIKTQEMIIDFHKTYCETEQKKVEIKKLTNNN